MAQQVSDEVLVRRIARRGAAGRAAFTELWERHVARLRNLAFRVSAHDDAVEEALQNTALNIWRKASTFRGQAAVSTWLYRILVNEVLMLARQRRGKRAPKTHAPDACDISDAVVIADRHIETAENKDIESYTLHTIEHVSFCGRLADPSPLPDEVLERKRTRERVRIALRALKPEYRECIIVRDLHDLTSADAAKILKLPIGALKSRIYRGKVKLREALLDVANG
jgi:RNA polymerase sigma-70 factor (ECF subfamily)